VATCREWKWEFWEQTSFCRPLWQINMAWPILRAVVTNVRTVSELCRFTAPTQLYLGSVMQLAYLSIQRVIGLIIQPVQRNCRYIYSWIALQADWPS
jgi:hypothetical protein